MLVTTAALLPRRALQHSQRDSDAVEQEWNRNKRNERGQERLKSASNYQVRAVKCSGRYSSGQMAHNRNQQGSVGEASTALSLPDRRGGDYKRGGEDHCAGHGCEPKGAVH